jgi:hypothetical protein
VISVRLTVVALVLCPCACARDGATFDAAQTDATDASVAQGAEDASGTGDETSAEGAVDEASLAGDATIVDAGPHAIGEPCTADAQCDNAPCVVVRNGSHSATLCVRTCGLFSPCPVGTTCYDDGTNRNCVKGCADAETCAPGLTCLPTYPPDKGCLPTP